MPSVPPPVLVMPTLSVVFVSVILPPTVNVPAVILNVRAVVPIGVVEFTAPVPRFKSLGPLKVMSEFQVCCGLLATTTGLPLVLPSVPLLIANDPVPNAYCC